MNGYTYFLFFGILIVIILFEYDFCVKKHLICDASEDVRAYAEMFCMTTTENLKSPNEGAYLRSYGRWQFYIVVQMFISAIGCRVDLKIRDLELSYGNTVGKRYVLTVCLLLGLIVCWMLTYFSMGGYFNIFVLEMLNFLIHSNGVSSPVKSVFPARAECLVEPMSTNETFTTTCVLPLNATAPYYFLALAFIYSITLLFILHAIYLMAKEKFDESCQLRCSKETSWRNPKESEANGLYVIDYGNAEVKLESLIKRLIRSAKDYWTTPNFSLNKSPSTVPLVLDA